MTSKRVTSSTEWDLRRLDLSNDLFGRSIKIAGNFMHQRRIRLLGVLGEHHSHHPLRVSLSRTFTPADKLLSEYLAMSRYLKSSRA